jgi:capsular polysaccharide biosynthesis protein
MDLMESLRTLRRRWILTSVLLLLTLAGTAAAVVMLPWTYQSQAMTVLLASRSASKMSGGNPYLAFDQSLTYTADLIRREVMDPRTALALAARGYTGNYLVTAATDTSGPVLLVTVTGSNKYTVENTLHGVTDELNTKLLALQAGSGVTPYNRITSLVVSMSPKATVSMSKKARPLVVVLALGMVLTFSIPQAVDARAARRRLRREAGEHASPGYPGDRATDSRRPYAGGRVPYRADPGRATSATTAKYDLDPEDQAPVSRFRSR